MACKKEDKQSLIIWDSPKRLTTMYFNTRLTKKQLNSTIITPRQRSILIGVLLSDGWKQSRTGWNPRMALKQSVIHFEYLWMTFIELSSLCSTYPYPTSNMKRGKLFYSLAFQTRQLKTLVDIRQLFYTVVK